MAERCEYCGGTGWAKYTGKDRFGQEREFVKLCVCQTRAKAEEEKKHPGGFRSAREIAERLPGVMTGTDLGIAQIIERHQGEANAIALRDLAENLWPEEWRSGNRETIEREIKASVSRLSTLGKMLIGVSRQKPYGYYLIRNAQELDANRARCIQHVRAWVRRLRALDPDGSAARQLYGQLSVDLGVNSE